ncbi:hypothetical protein ACWEKT_09505 [Nocardia takedensis]
MTAVWPIRSILSLLLWPTDPESESQLLQRLTVALRAQVTEHTR